MIWFMPILFVCTNQMLVQLYRFNYPLIVTVIQSISVTILLYLMKYLKFFKQALSVPRKHFLLLGFLLFIRISFHNLNLWLSPIGFYQFTELIIISISDMNYQNWLIRLIFSIIILSGSIFYIMSKPGIKLISYVSIAVLLVFTPIYKFYLKKLSNQFQCSEIALKLACAPYALVLIFTNCFLNEYCGPVSFIYHSYRVFEVILIIMMCVLATIMEFMSFRLSRKEVNSNDKYYIVTAFVNMIIGLIYPCSDFAYEAFNILLRVIGIIVGLLGYIFYVDFKFYKYPNITEMQKEESTCAGVDFADDEIDSDEFESIQ